MTSNDTSAEKCLLKRANYCWRFANRSAWEEVYDDTSPYYSLYWV